MQYIFETAHLKIRKFETTDAQRLYENHLEEEVKKWLPNESYADMKLFYDLKCFIDIRVFQRISFQGENTDYEKNTILDFYIIRTYLFPYVLHQGRLFGAECRKGRNNCPKRPV